MPGKPIKMIFTHMSMLSALPSSPPTRDSASGSLIFHQSMSLQFIKRSLLWHGYLLLFGLATLLIYFLILNGILNPPTSRRSIHILGPAGALIVMYCIAGLAWTWMLRTREYHIEIPASGHILLNGESRPDAQLKQSRINIFDACRLGDKAREVEALLLHSKKKHYVLFAHDQRENVNQVSHQLPVTANHSNDIIHLYGVL
ncbi:MAG: hypothetical protein WD114_02250 [Phycisphaerales bacterium]